MRTQRNWRPVDGVLLLDKSAGLSSNAALQQARRLFQAEKGGHMGTLDPFASGLLPLCFGEATKFSRFVLDADKTYRATLRLGITTSTGDPEGEVTGTCDEQQLASIERASVEDVFARFLGKQTQIPPRHAALKYQGRAYYDYARAGIDIPRVARDIDVHSLTLIDFSLPHLIIDAHVGKGTYIRTLAEDIGTAIGCGAHLSALRRTGSGPFSIDDALTLAALAALPEPALQDHLLPVEILAQQLPELRLSSSLATRLRQGQRLSLYDLSLPSDNVSLFSANFSDTLCAVYHDDEFIGVAEMSNGALRPMRLLNTAH